MVPATEPTDAPNSGCPKGRLVTGTILDMRLQALAVGATTTLTGSITHGWAGLVAIAAAVLLWLAAPIMSKRIAAMYQGTRLEKIWGDPTAYLWIGRLMAIGLAVVGVAVTATGSW